jgi:dTDP-4-dehydrorhamnose reductase
MHILVTGAKGQLGNEIALLAGRTKHQFSFHDIDSLDLTNSRDVLEKGMKISPDLIINCAAYTAVDKAESEPEQATQVNEQAVKNLVSLAKKTGAFLIHISTDYVFSGKTHLPYIETDATDPVSIYGKTKAAGEEAALSYEKSIVIRTSWLYSSLGNNFVTTMLRLGKEKTELSVVFDQVGTPTYAGDLANAILRITEQITPATKGGIFHYSNEGVASWYDFAVEIMDIAKLSCTVKPIRSEEYPVPAPRPLYSVLDKNKIKNTFHITIPHWKHSLKNCVKKLL